MTTTPLSTHAGPAARIVRAFSDVPPSLWDRLAGNDFYASTRWLRSVEGALSRESAYVLVDDGGGRPVAGLAAYLVDAGAYRFLNPPALIASEELRRELAPFQSERERAAVASLANELAPALASCYPIAVCVTPFGFTSSVVGDVGRDEVVRELLDAFEEEAQRWEARGCALLFLADGRREELGGALAARGYVQVTLGARCVLRVDWRSFDEYVESLRKKRRWTVRNEVRVFEDSGLRIVSADGSQLARVRDRIAPLFANLQGKYGHGMSVQSARNTLDWIGEEFADVARLILATDGDAVVAFCLLFEVGDTLYGYLTGQTYDRRARESFAHFQVGYYEPIKLAISRGLARIDDGTEGYDVKALRGYRPERAVGFLRLDGCAGAELSTLLALVDAAQRARLDASSAYRAFR